MGDSRTLFLYSTLECQYFLKGYGELLHISSALVFSLGALSLCLLPKAGGGGTLVLAARELTCLGPARLQ